MKINAVVHGFSLIECMLYCAITAFFLVLSTQSMVGFIRAVLGQQREALRTITVLSAIDGIARVCRSAPSQRHQWRCVTDSQISWADDKGMCAFQFYNKRLLHIVRTKDVSGQLLSPAYAVLLVDVEGSFQVDVVGAVVTCVHLAIASHDKKRSAVHKREMPIGLGCAL